jgi:flagellar hook-associated protein 3 FlgL
MRISTNSIFDGSSARLTDLQSKMNKISEQVASGRKMQAPSDDPVAAAQALEVQQSSAINSQFAKNRLHMQNTLGIVDGALSSISGTLQGIHENIVGAGSGVLSDSERSYYATALQGQYDQLMALANSTDGAGHYLFAGNKTDTLPFTDKDASGNPVAVAYNGDNNQSVVQVDTSREMKTSVTGSELFGANADIFAKLKSAITALNTPGGATANQALTDLGNSFDTTLNNVSNAQASVGIRAQEIDSLNSLGSDRELQYSQTLSSLQDLDYNKALSDLARQQLALQAAQKTFTQTSSLSLFNYIN